MEKDLKLKIEYVPIESLTPYEKNARKHENYDIKFIKNSIEKFGMCDPIGIWSDKNVIVEGHGRLAALKELGWKEVPVIRLDHLTNEERKAYGLAHNRTAEMSAWNPEILLDELEILKDDFDFNDLGFGEFINNDFEDDDPELKKHKDNGEKSIVCPYCGETILL